MIKPWDRVQLTKAERKGKSFQELQALRIAKQGAPNAAGHAPGGVTMFKFLFVLFNHLWVELEAIEAKVAEKAEEDVGAELGKVAAWLEELSAKVKALQGEAYREMLLARVARAGLDEAVVFDAGYRELDAVAAMIAEASVVILPYDSPDQVTSGVLVDAIAAGCPVISSAFPHAVELLGSGAGMVVPRQDPAALAAAIRRFVTEPGLADAMAAEARRIAPELAWTAVARRYGALGAALVAERAEALV